MYGEFVLEFTHLAKGIVRLHKSKWKADHPLKLSTARFAGIEGDVNTHRKQRFAGI